MSLMTILVIQEDDVDSLGRADEQMATLNLKRVEKRLKKLGAVIVT